MHRYTAILATAALVVFLLAGTLFAIDADEIIKRHLEAKGGIEKLKAMKSVYMKGKFIQNDVVGEVELAKRAPHFFSLVIKTPRGVMSQGCDGENMWSTNPRTGFHKIEGEEFDKRLSQTVMEPLLDFKEHGGRYEYIGIEDVRGDSCYKLLFIQKTGDSTFSFIDLHTYQMVKTETNTPGGLAEQFYEDFRDIDGYVFPFSVKVGSSLGKRAIIYDTIAVNEPVSDSFFVMPDPKSVPSVAQPLPDSVRRIAPQRD